MPTSDFLYLNAVTESATQGCKFRIRCTFKQDPQAGRSLGQGGFRRDEFEDIEDFSKFHLGNGSIEEKQQRVKQMVQNILTDGKQLRLCKERL